MATTFSLAAIAGSITLIATRSSVLTLQPSNTSPMPPRARKRLTSKMWLRTSPTLMLRAPSTGTMVGPTVPDAVPAAGGAGGTAGSAGGAGAAAAGSAGSAGAGSAGGGGGVASEGGMKTVRASSAGAGSAADSGSAARSGSTGAGSDG